MARPTKAKDPKPKAEGSGDPGSSALGGFKGIIINSVLTIVIMGIFTGLNYWMITKIIADLGPKTANESTEEGHGEAVSTIPYDLDDFIINLNNPGEKRYLKVKISLDITNPEAGEGGGEHAGDGGGMPVDRVRRVGGAGGPGMAPEAKAEDPKVAFAAKMDPYKMQIRDVINTVLSKMSAEELSTTTGKEQAKEAIKEELNTILPEDKQVQRVNFADFIIQ